MMDFKEQGIELISSMLPVSRESLDKLDAYAALVRKWQPAQNLVAPNTLDAMWVRHIADSVQIYACFPDARHWVDLGSGAGFPALVTAILLADSDEDHCVHMIESNGRKAMFLKTVSRELGLKTKIHNGRIDSVLNNWTDPVDAFSARALTSFDNLCGFVSPFISEHCVGVFHKGRDFDRELTEASVRWNLDLVQQESRTDPDARVVILRRISSKNA